MGQVFENYDRVPRAASNEVEILDRGSSLFLRAGSLSLLWSKDDETRGWVYYEPERVRVQIATARLFDTVRRSRFSTATILGVIRSDWRAGP